MTQEKINYKDIIDLGFEQVKTLIDFFSDEEKKVSNYPDLA